MKLNKDNKYNGRKVLKGAIALGLAVAIPLSSVGCSNGFSYNKSAETGGVTVGGAVSYANLEHVYLLKYTSINNEEKMLLLQGSVTYPSGHSFEEIYHLDTGVFLFEGMNNAQDYVETALKGTFISIDQFRPYIIDCVGIKSKYTYQDVVSSFEQYKKMQEEQNSKVLVKE